MHQQNPTRRVTLRQLILCIAIPAAISGCITTELVEPDDLIGQNDRDLVITMRSTLKYGFAARQYSVVTDSTGQQVIRGRGKVFRPNETQFESFEGDLPVSDIVQIATPKASLHPLVVPALIWVAAGALIWISIGRSLDGRTFGG